MGSTANRLKEGVRRWYISQAIPLDTPQLIAFSGGADSVALLYLLKELARMGAHSTDHLTIAYFNHNLRPVQELEQEICHIRETAEKWRVRVLMGEASRGELEERAVREKRSLEDVAREGRYKFLEKILEERGLVYLVLAHHANDQAETMISRYFQGSGLSGLSGIQPVQGNRLRPLLAYPKSQLVQCLREEGISWSEDSTNGDRTLLRNDLRQGLIPQLEETFPGFENSLSALSEKLSRYDHCLNRLSRELVWAEGENQFSIDRNLFFLADPALREYSLFRTIDRVKKGCRLSGGKGRRMPYRFIRPLLEISAPPRLNLEGHGLRISLDKKTLTVASGD
ncbi:MAG: tRNA lysidine(34) synthetase TilS [Spirochaetales bacterium]|nr:tRNA lysidine(34) synthetase TilS [Spirochaetales bacterium]